MKLFGRIDLVIVALIAALEVLLWFRVARLHEPLIPPCFRSTRGVDAPAFPEGR